MPDFARMIDELQYSIIALIAGIHWSLQEALLMAGYTVKLVNQWLIENAFMPIIAQTNNSLGMAVSVVFVVARASAAQHRLDPGYREPCPHIVVPG